MASHDRTPPGEDSRGGTAAPTFGPGGYLPQRAARRARKIVLREEMGLGWPLASLAAGLVVLVAGAAFLLLRGGPPGEPFAPVASLDDTPVGAGEVVEAGGEELLLVRVPGSVRAFLAPDHTVRWCDDSDRLESDDGSVWRLDGRLVGGDGASLRRVPVEVHDGTVHAATSQAQAADPPAERGETPVCGGG